jgi:hypothetical protein
LRGAKRRSNPENVAPYVRLDCFASLAMRSRFDHLALGAMGQIQSHYSRKSTCLGNISRQADLPADFADLVYPLKREGTVARSLYLARYFGCRRWRRIGQCAGAHTNSQLVKPSIFRFTDAAFLAADVVVSAGRLRRERRRSRPRARRRAPGRHIVELGGKE